MLETMEQRTEGMKKQAQELIEQAYNRGYKAGYEACKEPKDALIEKGRNEAWEAARKIMQMNIVEKHAIFGEIGRMTYSVILELSASEAIEKIKSYEEQKKEDSEIRVGDEVYFLDPTATRVVTCIYKFNEVTKAVQITSNGKWVLDDICDLHKTGRHFDEIENVLKKYMRTSDDR